LVLPTLPKQTPQVVTLPEPLRHISLFYPFSILGSSHLLWFDFIYSFLFNLNKMRLCQYKDIFGLPGKGVHSFRLFDIAVVDVVLSVILGYVIWLNTKWNPYCIGISVFLLGLFSHWIFCVRTTINNFLL